MAVDELQLKIGSLEAAIASGSAGAAPRMDPWAAGCAASATAAPAPAPTGEGLTGNMGSMGNMAYNSISRII